MLAWALVMPKYILGALSGGALCLALIILLMINLLLHPEDF
jgi:hypothetical protein